MKWILIIFALLSVSGCASLVTGTKQTVTIDTDPRGALCRVMQGKLVTNVKSTPSVVTLERSRRDLKVTCMKGNRVGETVVETGLQPMSAGNLLVGGPIGIGVDAVTGAAFNYPDVVVVKLK